MVYRLIFLFIIEDIALSAFSKLAGLKLYFIFCISLCGADMCHQHWQEYTYKKLKNTPTT